MSLGDMSCPQVYYFWLEEGKHMRYLKGTFVHTDVFPQRNQVPKPRFLLSQHHDQFLQLKIRYATCNRTEDDVGIIGLRWLAISTIHHVASVNV